MKVFPNASHFEPPGDGLLRPPASSDGQDFQEDAEAEQIIAPRESGRLSGPRLGSPRFRILRIESGSHRFVNLALARQGPHTARFRLRRFRGGGCACRVAAFRRSEGEYGAGGRGDQRVFHLRFPPRIQGCRYQPRPVSILIAAPPQSISRIRLPVTIQVMSPQV